MDLAAFIGSASGRIGFTAGTGGEYERHLIQSWSLVDTPTLGEPYVVYDQSTIDFGTLNSASAVTANLVVSNAAQTQALQISAAVMEGGQSANFSVTTTFPITIPAGGIGIITVRTQRGTLVGLLSSTLKITTIEVDSARSTRRLALKALSPQAITPASTLNLASTTKKFLLAAHLP